MRSGFGPAVPRTLSLYQLQLRHFKLLSKPALVLQLAENNALATSLARFRNHLADLVSTYQACREQGAWADGLLSCLAVLCEDVIKKESGSPGFRVLDGCGPLESNFRTLHQTLDVHEADLTSKERDGEHGIECWGPPEKRVSGMEEVELEKKDLDREKEDLMGRAADPDGMELTEQKNGDDVDSDRRRDGLNGESATSDGKRADSDRAELSESVVDGLQTRSGRKRRAPSAWWAVVDERACKKEKVEKKVMSEKVQKRKSLPAGRPEEGGGKEVALVTGSGELAEIDLEEEERR